jgi:hypothetical protein
MHPHIDQLLMKTRVADLHKEARRHSFGRAVARRRRGRIPGRFVSNGTRPATEPAALLPYSAALADAETVGGQDPGTIAAAPGGSTDAPRTDRSPPVYASVPRPETGTSGKEI